jgi:hypothetical protein
MDEGRTVEARETGGAQQKKKGKTEEDTSKRRTKETCKKQWRTRGRCEEKDVTRRGRGARGSEGDVFMASRRSDREVFSGE